MSLIPEIVLEQTSYLVLRKPAGLNVERLHDFASVEGWTEALLRARGVKKPLVGIVHRLDRPVSGLLLVARKQSALKVLNAQFAARTVVKHYLAWVEKAPPSSEGELRHWLIKDQLNKRTQAWDTKRAGASEASLHYRVLDTQARGHLLEIIPAGGKFHQIRAQLAAAGCPILGDDRYGATRSFGSNAIALHASFLAFDDPLTGARMELHDQPSPFRPEAGANP